MQQQSFEIRLADCMPPLERFALNLTKNRDRADDLVQDSIERALRKEHLFNEGNLRAWLFTICKRVFLNQVRSEKTKGVSVDIDSAPQKQLSTRATQEISIHYNEVSNALESLPIKDKSIISLVVFEGLKYEQAAETLDVPIGTIRSRLSRARQKLEQLLENPKYDA